MSKMKLRQKARVSYYEPEEPALDEYVFCEECSDFVYEYCSIHGALLVIPDDKVPSKHDFPSFVPRAALTIPHVFLHLAPSVIPGAGIGVFSTLTLPRGVRFGPYRGRRSHEVTSMYCWQIYDGERRPRHVVDAAAGDASNWMRYVNCARRWSEQNLVAFQYRGQLYYRTIKIIPRFTELMVFYGSQFANALHIDLRTYNSPPGYAQKFGAPLPKKVKFNQLNDVDPVKLQQKLQNQEVLAANPVSNASKLVKDPTNILQKPNPQKAVVKMPFINGKIDVKPLANKFICNSCSKVFTSKKHITKHIEEHKSIKITKINHKQNKVIDTSHINTGEKTYACHSCDYESTLKGNLKRHLRTHTGEKPYACHLCDYKCNQNSVLKIHLRTHTGEKPYACHSCDYKCNQKCDLKRHLRTHTGEKPYACHLCDYKCTVKDHLKRHLRTHTGEKPYACHLCDYKCTVKDHLKIHLRKHTGEKPYACHLCDYKCIVKGRLKLHLRTHTGEKPYACHLCDYKCAEKKSLKIHLRTHTGEKPYACHLCNYKSNQNSNLKIHLRSHTCIKACN